MQGRCKTCRYWRPFEQSGSCERIETNESWHELEDEEKAVISLEVDRYSAQLQTAPDFGCVLWEQALPYQMDARK